MKRNIKLYILGIWDEIYYKIRKDWNQTMKILVKELQDRHLITVQTDA